MTRTPDPIPGAKWAWWVVLFIVIAFWLIVCCSWDGARDMWVALYRGLLDILNVGNPS